jgi:hypothetical protein
MVHAADLVLAIAAQITQSAVLITAARHASIEQLDLQTALALGAIRLARQPLLAFHRAVPEAMQPAQTGHAVRETVVQHAGITAETQEHAAASATQPQGTKTPLRVVPYARQALPIQGVLGRKQGENMNLGCKELLTAQ